jgi:predicted lipoprotein with Yx(FWY)xxD motif
MKTYLEKTTKHVLITSFTVLLAACGGSGKGGGGYDNKSSYASAYTYSSVTYSSMTAASSTPPTSSVVASSVVASSAVVSSVVASSTLSNAASSSIAAIVPINQQITTIGGTFVGAGDVNVLLNVGGTLSTQLVTKTGMTLYVFDNDPVGQSACVSAGCITTWPPLLANVNAVASHPLSIIQRADGNHQWALRNKPLYFFVNDTQIGDVKGEGVSNNNWHVAVYQPVLPSKTAINAADGVYLTASGNVLVAMAASGNASAAAERLNRDYYSLYTFDADAAGASSCNGACLANWPALLADDNDVAEAPYSIITRSMGTAPNARQWAYQGKPLYFYIGDTAAGQTNGKSIANWRLARPMPVQVKSNASLGSLLTAAGWVKSAVPVSGVETTSSLAKHGFTLYTFDNDTSGTSNCAGGCLTNWPALIVDAGAVPQAPYSLVTRASGESQWALNGMPLYFYVGDTHVGDATGDAVGGVWHIARIPPVAADEGRFIAHGNIVNAAGVADNTRLDFTLYTFDLDTTSGVSTCNGGCLAAWPALYAPADATAFGDFTVVVRTGGDKQWAYKGKPLYFYVGDTAAGQTNGEYTDWTIARP